MVNPAQKAFCWKQDLPLTGILSSVQFSHSVESDSLPPHEPQDSRPPCSSPTPRIHSNSHPLSRWCHLAISSSVVPFSSCPQSLPASVFSNESTLHMRWPKYGSFSFSISPSNEYSGLISFGIDSFDLLDTQGTQKYHCAYLSSVQFSHSVVSDSLRPPWIAARQASLSITNSLSFLKLMSIESVMTWLRD